MHLSDSQDDLRLGLSLGTTTSAASPPDSAVQWPGPVTPAHQLPSPAVSLVVRGARPFGDAEMAPLELLPLRPPSSPASSFFWSQQRGPTPMSVAPSPPWLLQGGAIDMNELPPCADPQHRAAEEHDESPPPWKVRDCSSSRSRDKDRWSSEADHTAAANASAAAIAAGEVSSRGSDDEGDGATGGSCRKKLRLSKEQSTLLEESFKEHSTLNPKQKAELARQLSLRPRQVEVWFQNRRARTKLKQTEVDCELLKRCCESLTEENRRLQKEVAELRAMKVSAPCVMMPPPPAAGGSSDIFAGGGTMMALPAATLTMCPSCERLQAHNGLHAHHQQHPPPPPTSGASPTPANFAFTTSANGGSCSKPPHPPASDSRSSPSATPPGASHSSPLLQHHQQHFMTLLQSPPPPAASPSSTVAASSSGFPLPLVPFNSTVATTPTSNTTSKASSPVHQQHRNFVNFLQSPTPHQLSVGTANVSDFSTLIRPSACQSMAKDSTPPHSALPSVTLESSSLSATNTSSSTPASSTSSSAAHLSQFRSFPLQQQLPSAAC